MKSINKSLLSMAVAAAVVAAPAFGDDAMSFSDAIKAGKATLDFRYRMEDVSQDGTGDAQANTLRTRLNFQSGAVKGFSGFIEFDQVSELIEVDYNNGTGNGYATAVIADPEGTDLNQSYIQYVNGGTTVRYGRQRILLDNQRFIGGVGWRQNEQTFDAFSVTNTSIKNFKLFYANIHNTNTILGTNLYSEDNIVNASYKISSAFTVTGYAYMLGVKDVDNSDDDTIGIRVNGALAGFSYAAEYATESARKAGQSKDYSASYTGLNGSYQAGPVNLGLGYELLGADGTLGEFETKYGTKHAFQGWADEFLNTPNGGIEDLYVSAGSKIGSVNASVVYHSYGSDDKAAAGGIRDFGTELDFVVSGKAGPVGLLAKYADYSADGLFTDTRKIWLMASMTF